MRRGCARAPHPPPLPRDGPPLPARLRPRPRPPATSLDFHFGLVNRPRRHRPRAGLVLGDRRLEHGERESRRGVILELPGVERQLAGALADGMRNDCAQIARGEIDPIGFAHVRREVARQLPLEPIEVPLELGAHRRRGQPPGPAPGAKRDRRNSGGAPSPPTTSFATSSPTAGPCLKPCPEPPPTSQTFVAAGWWSMMKCSSGEFSYWHTRASTSGAPFRPGNRNVRYSRAAFSPSGVGSRSPVVGSNGGPRVSSATLNPRHSLPGIPYMKPLP